MGYFREGHTMSIKFANIAQRSNALKRRFNIGRVMDALAWLGYRANSLSASVIRPLSQFDAGTCPVCHDATSEEVGIVMLNDIAKPKMDSVMSHEQSWLLCVPGKTHTMKVATTDNPRKHVWGPVLSTNNLLIGAPASIREAIRVARANNFKYLVIMQGLDVL